MSGLDDVARNIVAVLEKLGITYAVMGGLAVRLYGLPRATFDVDFTVSVARERLPQMFDLAEEVGFTVPAAQRSGWIDTVRGLSVVKLQWSAEDRAVDVDIFLAETRFQQRLLARRIRYLVDGWEAWFVTAEDLILLKLIAARPKDLADIADVFFVQGQLDEAYLKARANELGLRDALTGVLPAS